MANASGRPGPVPEEYEATGVQGLGHPADTDLDAIVAHHGTGRCVVERSAEVNPVFGTDICRLDLDGEELHLGSGPYSVDLSRIAPDGMPIAGDGFGNFWVVDVRAGRSAEVLFVSHDPPVVLLQAPTLGGFVREWFAAHLGRGGRGNPIVGVHRAAMAIWRRPPRDWDAREARIGTGIPWAGPNAAVRPGTEPVWRRPT